MQVDFKTDYLRMLFQDKYFQDDMGIKATQAYRLVVNYLCAANSPADLKAAKFLDFSGQPPSIKIDPKRRLYLEITDDKIHVINIVEKL